MLLYSLLVVQNPVSGRQNHKSELSAGEDVINELIEILEPKVVSGGDNSTLVESTSQFNHNLASSLVVNYLELTDVA